MADWNAANAAAVKVYLRGGKRRTLAGLAVHTEPGHNLTAIGVGAKYVNGERLKDHAVRFYVERKVPERLMPKEHVLPKEIGGAPTDVIESGRFSLHSSSAPGGITGQPIAGRVRPVRPGCSCSYQLPPPDQGVLTVSTLGAIVQAAGKKFILSNNHALANSNSLAPGAPIFQPALLDGADTSADQIAALTRFVKIDRAAMNVVDCAIAQLLDGIETDGAILPGAAALASADPVKAADGMQVAKTGRTTGYTEGEVFEVNGTVPIPYPFGMATFENQIFVRGANGRFSADGDSGALVIDRATRQATGLLFAGSTNLSVCNPLDAVLAGLGVSLVI